MCQTGGLKKYSLAKDMFYLHCSSLRLSQKCTKPKSFPHIPKYMCLTSLWVFLYCFSGVFLFSNDTLIPIENNSNINELVRSKYLVYLSVVFQARTKSYVYYDVNITFITDYFRKLFTNRFDLENVRRKNDIVLHIFR